MSRFRLPPRLVLDPRLATVLLALAATLLPVALVAAATSPLGFTLGQTTLDEVDRSLPGDKLKVLGIGGTTKSTRLVIDPAPFDLDGLENAVLVFDPEHRLVGVVLTMAKDRFRDLLVDLHAEYSVDRESIDHVTQNGDALFRSGDDWIHLEVLPLSFSLKLTYATDELWCETVQTIEKDKARKRQQDRGKLLMRCPPLPLPATGPGPHRADPPGCPVHDHSPAGACP